MPAPGQERVEVDVLANEGASLARRFPLDRFVRLAGNLAAKEGEAVAHFAFAPVAEGVPACEMEVEALLTLTCQRCLEPYGLPVHSTTKLVFVGGEAGDDVGRVPEGYEAIPAPGARVDLAELVEDELLLSLPVVALHGEGTRCAGSARQGADVGREERAVETHRPFAQLQDLLKH